MTKVRVSRTSTLIVPPEMAKLLHRIQQQLNAGQTCIKVVSTPEAEIGIESASGEVEIIKRRRVAYHDDQ